MRKTILIAALFLAACATTATTGDEGRTYSVYDYPDAKDKGTLPVYRVKEMPNGEVRVYDYGNPFEPKYIIRGNEAYKPGDPFQPVGNIKDGVPYAYRERGEVAMAVLAQCPMCHRKQATKNKTCKCGENLDKAKQAKRVKYYIQYRLPDGTQKKESVTKFKDLNPYSIEDARKAEAKRTVQKKEGRTEEIFNYKKESTWTFSQLAEWWFKQDSVKARSDCGRLEIAFKKFNQVFGERLIRDVKLSELRNYQSQRRKEGQADSTTDHETHSAAKAAVKAAWFDNEISAETWKTWQNFKKLISGKKARKQYARSRVLEIEEYCRLIPHSPYHLAVLVGVALFTGMRKSELVPDMTTNGKATTGLTWDQIDLQNGKISLRETKTGIPRDIPITEELESILKAIPRTLGTDNVFTYQGKPFGRITTALISACRAAAIPYGKKVEGGFVFGDLRRTAKTLMARAGVDKAYRDAILGHESQDMDRHYLHPDFEKDLRFAMEKYHTWLRGQIQNVTHSVTHEAISA